MAVKNYSARKVNLSVGSSIGRGFGDGEFVRLKDNVRRFSLKVGVDGETARDQDHNESALLEVTVMQTSDWNDELSALHEADKATMAGAGIVPFRLNNSNGRALYTAAECWIAEPPEVVFAKGVEMRKWVIEIARLVRFDGGG